MNLKIKRWLTWSIIAAFILLAVIRVLQIVTVMKLNTRESILREKPHIETASIMAFDGEATTSSCWPESNTP